MVPETPALLTITSQAAELFDRRRDQAADLVEFCHIGLDEVGVGADVAGQRRARVTVDVADQHLGALGREAPRQALAKPGSAAGHDCDLALEFVAH